MVEKSHSHFSESNFFNEIKGWPKLFLTRRPPQFSFTLLPSFSVITFVIPMTFTTPQSVLFSLILFFEKFNFSCKSSCHSLSALLCTFWAYKQDYFWIESTFDSTVFRVFPIVWIKIWRFYWQGIWQNNAIINVVVLQFSQQNASILKRRTACCLDFII